MNAEVVEIKDIVTDDLTDVLKGVGAIIHAASPLAGRASAQDTLKVRLVLSYIHTFRDN